MSFQLATLAPGGDIPPTAQRPLASGEDFEDGALLLVNASDEFAECGADPDSVAAVAESGAGAESDAFRRPANREFPPGYMQGTPVRDERLFTAEYVGTLPAAAGGSYGVVKDTDDRWKVDFDETTNLVVKLQDIHPTESPFNDNRVIVSFLTDVVQVID